MFQQHDFRQDTFQTSSINSNSSRLSQEEIEEILTRFFLI